MYHPDDTIAAIASAPGGAARGIVRISGPATRDVLAACFEPRDDRDFAFPPVAHIVEGRLLGDEQGLGGVPASVYWWPDERSYTRQQAAEVHLLGSPPLVSAALASICASGARLAEPGEFTLRAFLAGRLDLTQAEAVLGVIEARGDDDLKRSLEQLAGNLARPLHALRESLLELLAHLEAGLDFVEEDIEFVSRQQLATQLEESNQQLRATIAQLHTRRRSESLPRVALVGWPNVGKSSLFNALTRHSGALGDSSALVSNVPGTTRDYLTATIELDGLPLQLIDTAGYELAAPQEVISQAAQRLSGHQAEFCDVELLCLDSTRQMNPWEASRLASVTSVPRLVIATKTDLPHELPQELASAAIATSASKAAGLETLRRQLRETLEDLVRGEAASSSTAERCGGSLQAASEAILRASELNATASGEELVAAELRTALGELGKVVGAVYTDDILDRVFSRFCIGK